MSPNRMTENVLGTMGAICWTIQLIPQVWKSWREKSTKGLSHYLVLLWSIGAGFLGTYAIVQNLNVPLIVQPQLFGILSLISWGQCLYYDNKYSQAVSIASVIAVAAGLGGFEVGMVFAVRVASLNDPLTKGLSDHLFCNKPSHNAGAAQVFGILSSVLLSTGLLPQYYEIYKHREVIGISVASMMIDMTGGIFSDLSLAFRDGFSITASITYSLVVVLDGLILIAALILNPAARRRREHLATEMAASSGSS